MCLGSFFGGGREGLVGFGSSESELYSLVSQVFLLVPLKSDFGSLCNVQPSILFVWLVFCLLLF